MDNVNVNLDLKVVNAMPANLATGIFPNVNLVNAMVMPRLATLKQENVLVVDITQLDFIAKIVSKDIMAFQLKFLVDNALLAIVMEMVLINFVMKMVNASANQATFD